MKVYEKPRVHIEEFQLSHHVADCGWELNAGSATECNATPDSEWGYPDGVTAFTTSVVSTCVIEPEGYCYTNSSSAVGLFRS